MNSTENDETNGFSTTEYVLLTITCIEQVLSFTGTDSPKSIVQVVMSIFYQSYKWCFTYREEALDTASVQTTKTTSSHFSVNVGSRV